MLNAAWKQSLLLVTQFSQYANHGLLSDLPNDYCGRDDGSICGVPGSVTVEHLTYLNIVEDKEQ